MEKINNIMVKYSYGLCINIQAAIDSLNSLGIDKPDVEVLVVFNDEQKEFTYREFVEKLGFNIDDGYKFNG